VPEKRDGAVRDLFRAMKALKASEQGYLIFCADNYFDFPLSHFLLPCLGHQDHAFVGLKDVASEQTASKYGVVQMDEHSRITTFEEKPERPKSTVVSVGVYYLPSKFQLRVYEYLEIEKLSPDRIGDFIAWLTRKEQVYGVEFDGTWLDIGDLKSYESARRLFHAAQTF
jgi:glucose-1-phosphate thymidylyltransferase